ncbi:alanine racemase [Ectothiorhodospira magna]|uniref:Alanine racemase n=1 Tax=Ectothiorhodospira magna TaxID=867345 RepID=A0A1H9FAB0_9GAMM|nr:alanine racemase [Ectothiorhodospira magna]SEQ34870.1 alanine racemase [Ectothiorhodospira magna]
MRRTASAQLCLGHLSANLARVRVAAPGRRIMAVIKAEAYGHGLLQVAECLAPQVDALAVSCLDEASALREAGYRQPVLALQGFKDERDLHSAAQLGVAVTVHEDSQLRRLATTRLQRPVQVWLKLDTGMGRLGFAPSRATELMAALTANTNVAAVTGLMTHLACADTPHRPENATQLARFQAATRHLPGERSLANSAAILALPNTHADWVRPGIMLYGGSPLADQSAAALGLHPVMTLTTRLIGIHTLMPGEAVGYGATWRSERPSRVGVAAIGYADGYPRHAPSGTPVLVRGQRVPLIGRVSMDMITVDLTDLETVQVGDQVTLWGQGLPVDEVAMAAGTISYDLLCRVHDRVRVTTGPMS